MQLLKVPPLQLIVEPVGVFGILFIVFIIFNLMLQNYTYLSIFNLKIYLKKI